MQLIIKSIGRIIKFRLRLHSNPEELMILFVLQFCEDKLKGISLLPMVDNVYQQMPYEEITKEKYEEMKAKIKPMNYKTTKDKAVGTKFCDGDSCTLV